MAKSLRDWSTPLIIGGFTLMGVTGVLMFFHLHTPLNKVLHEWGGLVFVMIAFAHIVSHFRSFRLHFRDPVKLGLSVQAFVQVQMARHGTETATAFSRLVATRPEVISAWTLTGEADYLLRVYCTDLPALNALIHDVILPHPAVARVQSQIVMEQLKRDAPLPT